MVTVGTKAPDFTLAGTHDASVRLYDRLGSAPVLLLFYPLDWSPVCTAELCGLRDGFREFSALGCTVFGISVDSIFSHKAFAEKLGIPFQLLSDFNREACRAYGAFHEEILGLKGIAKRAAFLLDAGGIVRYRWVSDDPGALPDFPEIRQEVQKLTHPSA